MNLKILSPAGKNKFGAKLVWIQCHCGNIKAMVESNARKGKYKSCGCIKYQITHGMTKTKLYHTWQNIKQRCYNEKNDNYKWYGARGIKVCDEWLHDFMAFYNDVSESYYEHVKVYGEKDTTMDRINNNGNYSKANCKWSTLLEQARNKRYHLNDSNYIKRNPVTGRFMKHTDI